MRSMKTTNQKKNQMEKKNKKILYGHVGFLLAKKVEAHKPMCQTTILTRINTKDNIYLIKS